MMAYVYTNNGFIIIIHPPFSIRDKWNIVSTKRVCRLCIVDLVIAQRYLLLAQYYLN